MKNITLIISTILFATYVSAQTKMYVMQNNSNTEFPISAVDSIRFSADQNKMIVKENGTPTEFTVSSVDSIIFYDPNGGGTDCGDLAHVTKNATTPAQSFSPQIIYQNDFSPAQNSGNNVMVIYNASYDNPSLTAAGTATFNNQAVVTIQRPAPSIGDGWHVSLSQYMGGIPFVKGDNYEFSIDMKTPGPGKVVTVILQENGVDANNDGNSYSPVVGKDLYATGTMQTFKVDWRPHFSAANTRLLIWVGGDATGLTVDNIKITRTGPSATPGKITTQAGLPLFDCASANFQEGPGTVTDFSNTEGNQYVTQYNYFSPSNQTTVGLDVVLPPNYATSGKRYPVLYYLHGHGANEAAIQWFGIDKTATEGMASGAIDDFILVSIGGPRDSWWSDGDNGVNAESHIIYEILPLVDAKFRTLGTKNSRAIMGFSMGGWGAAKLGVKYPGFFKAVMTWCGALYTPGPVGASINGGFWDGITSIVDGKPFPGFADNYTAIWSDNTEDYAYDCARAMLPVQASLVKTEGVQFFVHENTGYILPGTNYQYDDQFMLHGNDFVKELQAAGIPVQYSESPCLPDPSNPNDSAPHSPKNMTAADIQKVLSVMQVN